MAKRRDNSRTSLDGHLELVKYCIEDWVQHVGRYQQKVTRLLESRPHRIGLSDLIDLAWPFPSSLIIGVLADCTGWTREAVCHDILSRVPHYLRTRRLILIDRVLQTDLPCLDERLREVLEEAKRCG